jgi:uncharacterized protein (DUF2345 family)
METMTTDAPGAASVTPRVQVPGAVIGTLVRFSPTGQPLLVLASEPDLELVAARSCVRLTNEHVNGDVVVVFEGGRPDKPIVIGLLQATAVSPEWTADVDGARVSIAAREEIVLSCGQASITLTKAGKILIRGAYISNHASGVNRIKGATVEIN